MGEIGRFHAARFLVLLLVLFPMHIVHGQPLLDFEYMRKTEIAAELNVRVYTYDVSDPENKYDSISAYMDGADGALLATQNGRCFVAFQGLDIFDPRSIARENTMPGTTDVCPDGVNGECCTVRTVIWDTYDTSYRIELERDIERCRADCPNPDDCLYLSGYSNGGATAQLAAILLQDMRAHVITFGTGKTINPECRLTNPTRWVGWANSRNNIATNGLEYDQYVWQPSIDGLANFGYIFSLSNDISGVANFGLNNRQANLLPYDPISLVRTHRMNILVYPTPGYKERIDALRDQNFYPISITGYASGSLCTVDQECVSKECNFQLVGLRWTKVCA